MTNNFGVGFDIFSQNGPVVNPAFTRIHPARNIVYSCTESVEDNGEVIAWKLCHETGKLSFLSAANAHGTSTCYITIDKVKIWLQNCLNSIDNNILKHQKYFTMDIISSFLQ